MIMISICKNVSAYQLLCTNLYWLADSTRTSPALMRTPLISAENTWSMTIDVSMLALRLAGTVLSIGMRAFQGKIALE